MKAYINFYFKDIKYNDDYYSASFSCPDLEVKCDFKYNRNSQEIEIWNASHPKEDILPLPIWWLDSKLKENGVLNEKEQKISY